MKYSTIRLFVLAALLYVSSCVPTKNKLVGNSMPYSPVSKELYDTIAHLDSILFSAANRGDLDVMKTFFTEDLEFFHDAGGLAGYEKTMENFQRVFTNYKDTRRILIPGSMEVYPIKDYGAIQTGLHKYCQLKNGVYSNCGTFKFLHVWKKTSSGWKISRVISYGHN
jgi:ketosteroid isomerase-like protein